MESNEIVRKQILEIIKNQMKQNDPPETNLTYKRLTEQGFSDFEAKQYIGQCVAVELFEVFKNERLFDEKKFVANLKNLPKEPM